MRNSLRLGTLMLIGCVSAAAWGQALQSDPSYVGQRGVAVADATLPRPPVEPCVVTLFPKTGFNAHGDPTSRDAQPHVWHYAPPARCNGAWSKVVLEADFSVTPGRQYDRTASLWLRGVNLYFGTTQEPDADVGPHWHIERDVTDYAGLFRESGDGQTILNNWVSNKYTGIISGQARLLFYPATKAVTAAPGADRVYGLVGATGGQPVAVADSSQVLERTLTLPRNVERAYLDVLAQSQAVDEQWYMCIDDADVERTREFSLGPPNAGDPLEQCGNGSYREVEVDIDGQPAGRAPVYPWTYTGGVNPHLWRPTPGIQTLNFVPYRVDLTPFSGLLDDGKPHRVAVRVLGAHNFFSLAGNLLIYQDHGRSVLSGRLIRNTLASDRERLKPQVQRDWDDSAGIGMDGHIDTLQQTDYLIEGQLQTSHGRVTTLVQQQSHFANRQRFLHPDASTYHQIITLDTQVTDSVSRTEGDTVHTRVQHLHYPQVVDIVKRLKPTGDFTADIDMRQGYGRQIEHKSGSQQVFWSKLDNALDSHSSADFNAGGTAITGTRDQHGHQRYQFSDSLGSCYDSRVDSRNEAVSAVSSGQSCPNGKNHLDWRSQL